MVALSLPFIWIGVVLTLKRLRSAALPAPLIALFFFPFLNLLFFLVLCLVPERDERPAHSARKPVTSFLARITPENQFGSAAVRFADHRSNRLRHCIARRERAQQLRLGNFCSHSFHHRIRRCAGIRNREPRSFAGCVGVACLAVSLLGLGLLALAVGGVFCLIMALPLALPLAAFGGTCAYFVQKLRWRQAGGPAFLSAILLFAPGVEIVEHALTRPSPVFVVRTRLDVQAPPERVWKEVVAFTQIPPPSEWMFRAGIAYPIRAEMIGTGVGAERHCVFSTGAFVEPIQIWDPPRQLKFSVVSNPAPMEEWTPYKHIEPPHLHGFLVSEGGQFILTPLPNGGTRLEGTTWYKHGLWPSHYWQLWSDAIIHRIHLRVLRHIRDQAEHNPS